ncbi:RNA-directed DNA polymerase, eukaryota, reverse transcriptase zinc-binding domain protein [Tanacetum coccineum]|uniref:RNA-directed DNA polymerase, eukaryota, reverse transcriptase zinc-binding domain protein n=1 Tax=Tanacetum coccineum TaxID=301880 RepID=A0ABQ5IQE9_9ASTR
MDTNNKDEIRNETESMQMKDNGNKAGRESIEDPMQFSGGSKSKSKPVSKNQERNKNKFDILRDYDEEGMNDRGMLTGRFCFSKAVMDFRIGIWNVRGMCTSDKQKEVAKFILEEKLQVCSTLETHLKSKKLVKACEKAFGNWE